MPRRGENIYRRKDGRWEGRYMKFRDSAGKAKYGYVYARSYAEVKSKLKEISAGEKNEEQNSDCAFRIVADQWLEQIRPQIKESSYVKYYNMVRNHILPEFGDLPVSELTSRKLEEFVESQLIHGRLSSNGRLAPKTVKDILAAMNLIRKYAIRRQMTVSYQVEPLKTKREEKKVKVLDLQDQKLLEQYLLNREDPVCDGILLSLYTGIRIGELCALRWQNILLADGILQIRYTMQRIQDLTSEGGPRTKVIITPPKSSCSVRDIPLPAFLVKRLCRFTSPAPLSFFLTGSSRHWMEPRAMSNQLKYILQRCGIAQINFHALRHTFATRCIEKSFDIKALSEILGHSSVNITLNRYVHTSMEQKRKNMEMMNI